MSKGPQIKTLAEYEATDKSIQRSADHWRKVQKLRNQQKAVARRKRAKN